MTTAIHVLMAIVLFVCTNWIGRHSIDFGYKQLTLFAERDEAPAFNFLLRVLAPSVFIILCSTALYSANMEWIVSGIWLVALYQFGLRFLFNIAWSRSRLLNWASQFAHATIGVGLAYFAYKHVIEPRDPLFPDARTIANELWIAIAVFLYAVLNKVELSSTGTERRKNKYIALTYERMRRDYGTVINGNLPNAMYELAAYAILLYENFNRPPLVRRLEWLLYPWSKTLGIMQSDGGRRISDLESVELGVARLRAFAQIAKSEGESKSFPPPQRYNEVRSAISHFHKDDHYISEIFELMSHLARRTDPTYRAEFNSIYSYMSESAEIDIDPAPGSGNC